MNLLTPTQIIQQKPSIQNYFSVQQLGTLLYLGLVRGKRLSRTCHIAIEDVEALVERKKLIQTK